MSNIQNSPNQIDDVLSRIQAKETSKRRRRQGLLLIAGLLLMGAGAGAFAFFRPQPQAWEVYNFASLDSTALEAALQNDFSAILVNHPDLGTETLRSLGDYANMLRISQAIEMMKAAESRPVTDTVSALQVYPLDIAGDRIAKELLVFTIEDYDAEVEYLLDFGNGVRRLVQERTRYRYPLPGNFEVRLLASRDSSSSLYEKRFSIAPAPVESVNVIAEEASDPIQENPVTPSETLPGTTFEEQEPDPSLFVARDASPIEPTVRSGNEEQQPEAAPETIDPEIPPTAEPEQNTPVRDPNQAYLTSDVPPSFPGGKNAMARYIQRKFRYTPEAIRAKVDGVIIMRFIVNVDGSLSEIKVLRGLEYGLDEAAVALVSAMPRWNPGRLDGQNVRVYHTIPITIRLLNLD